MINDEILNAFVHCKIIRHSVTHPIFCEHSKLTIISRSNLQTMERIKNPQVNEFILNLQIIVSWDARCYFSPKRWCLARCQSLICHFNKTVFWVSLVSWIAMVLRMKFSIFCLLLVSCTPKLDLRYSKYGFLRLLLFFLGF